MSILGNAEHIDLSRKIVIAIQRRTGPPSSMKSRIASMLSNNQSIAAPQAVVIRASRSAKQQCLRSAIAGC